MRQDNRQASFCPAQAGQDFFLTAGLAAALAARRNVTPRALPYAELKAGMTERGIRFE